MKSQSLTISNKAFTVKQHLQSCSLLLMAIILGLITYPAEARFKCWTNSEGVKECGETVPPEYSQQGHQEVSTSGIVMDKTDAAKTEEEIAEENRLVAEEKAREKARKEQLRQDRILLETFSSVDDISMTRDGKVHAIETSIKLTNKRSETIQTDLDNRIKQAAAAERQGKEPPADLLKDIESLKQQIKDNDQYIANKQKEQQGLLEEYAEYETRYKKLKKLD